MGHRYLFITRGPSSYIVSNNKTQNVRYYVTIYQKKNKLDIYTDSFSARLGINNLF